MKTLNQMFKTASKKFAGKAIAKLQLMCVENARADINLAADFLTDVAENIKAEIVEMGKDLNDPLAKYGIDYSARGYDIMIKAIEIGREFCNEVYDDMADQIRPIAYPELSVRVTLGEAKPLSVNDLMGPNPDSWDAVEAMK